MATRIRQAPLLDRFEDSELFVAPDDYARASWAAAQGLNLLLIGTRGAGKTTVLHQLQLALRSEPGAHPVFVDLSSANSVEVALTTLVGAASEALDRPLTFAPSLPRPGESAEDHAARVAIAQLSVLERCTLLIDNVRPEHVGFPLFGIFRDRLWETPHQWIVAASPGSTPWLLRPPADAFWEEAVELGYSAAAGLELVARRVGGRPPWLEEIVGEVGTNPRRLLQAALTASRSPQDAATVLHAWQDWHRRLGALERREALLMAELASRPPVSASDEELLSSLGWARSSLLRSLEHLETAGYVESWSEASGTGRPRRLFAALEPGRPSRA